MALSRSTSTLSLTSFFLLLTLLSTSTLVISQPALNSAEQESVYQILESINSAIPWRSLYPDDLCISAPHGVVCDYFSENTTATIGTPHVTEMSFGYVSDYSPNPPCTPKSTINPLLFSSFPQLRKLLFYKCFTETTVTFPDFSTLRSSLEELVFIGNPSLVGSLRGNISNLTALKRLILTGNNVSGEIPDGLGDLVNLEQLSLSRNNFHGEVTLSLEKLKKLKILDLSQNGFEGSAPEPLGSLQQLLKLDLSFNNFSGKIPENLKGLKKLEFLDLSYNGFAQCGVPLFLAEMPSLREVYLSGNLLGGQIPEIWDNLGGILGIGLSEVGLVGNIPSSMGMFLRNLSYLGLDNNKLEGMVPEEFGALESVNELNLENNNLSGRVPFSAKFVSKVGGKLKLEGNPELCADEGLRSAKVSGSLGQLKLCNKPVIPHFVLLSSGSSVLHDSYMLIFVGFLFLLS
ncbi:unnamed protein product [Ilex paraguariensis]|uniref:Disease resistance R13L4/SHOC-2-like LRR domain-containing protein n=1 Tax=Ilex paraguariensis TaxID=185542 RepID=A0ABC8TTJ5_9AQUA